MAQTSAALESLLSHLLNKLFSSWNAAMAWYTYYPALESQLNATIARFGTALSFFKPDCLSGRAEPRSIAGEDNWSAQGHRERLSHRDYTVGWICALEIEMTAAKVMLDDIHEALPISREDSNTYTLGNMGTHNIVIACLPLGRYGLTNAATVANNMRRTFTSIRFGLMVGVGGGVPGKVDVRLGDVVVSKEVVQYDFGKRTGDSQLRPVGSLNKPPHVLATAVAKLQADHRTDPSRIPSILANVLVRYPGMINFTRSGTLQDRLFDAIYDHIEPSNQPMNPKVDSCEHCDVSRLVHRPARSNNDPKIHYGIVASANQVIKHGRTRDQLAKELDAICFEMEAAGLMNSFPCLVIRGVCDYADSHKNKQWQPYAAMTAAAYAKELLSVISTDRIKQKSKPTSSVGIDPVLQERRKTLLESLEFKEIHSRRLGVEVAHEETCNWLLEDPVYQRWLDRSKLIQHHGFLWIKGKPGAGKSTIMKLAYSQAMKMMGDSIIISFFFNARGDNLEKSIVGMYRSLLWELLSKASGLQKVLDDADLIPSSHYGQPIWSAEVLRSLLSLAIASLGRQRLVCFVDALDECNRKDVYGMIDHFQTIGKDSIARESEVYICFSSRNYPFIDIGNGQELILEHHSGHEHDLEAYIHSKLKVKKHREAEVDELRNDIRVKANGVFLWVKLVVQMLNEDFGYADSLAIQRKTLEEIPPELSDLIRDILRRDNKRPENLLLSIEWILFSKRPLKWEELYFALLSGLHPDTISWWNRRKTTIQDMKQFILSSSKGLAEITKPNAQTVQFIHESVRDFLLKDDGLGHLRRDLQLETEDPQCSAHDRLKRCCHTYIQFDISPYVSLDTPRRMGELGAAGILRRSFPFMEYAAQHILGHAETAGNSLPQRDFITNFPIKSWIVLNNIFRKLSSLGPQYTPNASLLYILAKDGLTNLIRSAFDAGFKSNIHRERLENPLFAALANEHHCAVKALLQQEMRVSEAEEISAQLEYGKYFSASKGYTPLHWAIQRGDIPLATILLGSKEIVPVVSGSDERTPLSLAAENGHESIVRLLLAIETVQLDPKDYMDRTPLSLAAIEGHESIVRLLLSTGNVDVNSKDYSGSTASEAGSSSPAASVQDQSSPVWPTCKCRDAKPYKPKRTLISPENWLDKVSDSEGSLVEHPPLAVKALRARQFFRRNDALSADTGFFLGDISDWEANKLRFSLLYMMQDLYEEREGEKEYPAECLGGGSSRRPKGVHWSTG
ncbi:nacht ankyrin domain-containing protein [Fusarium circinatum]|uniref:Nacht ankyrin domain-containing protein n=1 Tax=Fusarium circinatum TaxID=48490 RepID=A0A8H5SZM6_FUSCI|nr:nacht ankyrin domain-containing protein [Fusarium circinatum]